MAAGVDETMADRDSAGGPGWRRAVALVLVAFGTSVVQPSLVVAIPFLILVGMRGMRGGGVFLASVVAMLVVVAGPRDGFWYAERAWALVAGGAFVALSLLLPEWRLTSRALGAVAGAVVAFALLLVGQADAWATLDWTISDRIRSGFTTWFDAMTVLRQGEAPAPTLVTSVYRTVEAQVSVFPALLAIETMAALGAAWWVYGRLVERTDEALGPLARFRFNDHLVWLMVAGLVLLVTRGEGGAGLGRVGANLAVFMAALYGLRGLAVGLAVTGGLSLFGYAMLALGFLVMAPVVVGFAVLLGIADTWLDLRERVPTASA